jgi:hypothetical protein
MTALGTRDRAPVAVDADVRGELRDADAPPTRTGRAWLARWWGLLVVLVVAVVTAIVVRDQVYPGFSWNRDEVTYLWQVSVLRGREVFGETGGFPQFFQPWLTGLNEHGFFSQYTLGWPLVLLAADVAFGDSAVAILVGVVALIGGSYAFTREVTRNHALAVITCALVVASPFYMVQSGVYLGYLFSTGIGLLFGAALLAGMRRDDWRVVALGGALLGFLFLVRPYDAVLWAGALGLYGIIANWRRWRVIVRAAVIAVAAFLPFLVLTLAYNRAVTGSFTEFPFTAKEPLDRFGFGLRRLMPRTPLTNFTHGEAVRGELRNAFYFPQFLVGAWFGVAVALVGLWLRRRQRSTLALLGLAAVFPVGYSVFWGIRLSSFYAFLSAPLYFLPAYVPACILIGTVILTLWRRRRRYAVVLGAALIVVTIPFAYSRLDSNRAVSLAQEPWRDAVEDLRGDSLVFVASSGPFLMHLNPFSRNTPTLDGPILYAVDRPDQMLDLMAAHPGRRPYLEVTSDPALADAFHHPYPDVPTITMLPLTVLRGRELTVRAHVTAQERGPLVASLKIGDTVDTRVLAEDARPGQVFDTEWRVGIAATGGVPGTVALPADRGRISVRVASPDSVDAPFARRHLVQRFSYRTVDGTIEVLNPARQLAVRHRDGRRVVRESLALPGYAVDLVANS